MVEEQLSRHDEEREIMKEPSQEEETTEGVIEYDGRCIKLTLSAVLREGK